MFFAHISLMKSCILIVFIIIFSSLSLHANCEGLDNLNSVRLSNNQDFKYRFLKGSDSTQPTVVYLPGGPGQGSIDESDPRLSTSYGFIQTDPRGVGCNADLYSSNVNLSSIDLALDIVELIKKENLDNYIIYGLSYGTALATVVAYYLERDDSISNPKSLVLEGVLGRAFLPQEEDQAILIEWERYKQQAVLLNLFKAEEPSLGFSSFEIGQFLKGLLSFGRNPYNPQYYLIENYFNLLQGSQDNRETLISTIRDFNEPYSLELIQLYRQIGCEEFSSLGWGNDVFYINGELTLGPSTRGICEGYPFINGFDSANYKLKSKIYYFNGTNDPATPLWQAQHHIDHQLYSQKNVITVQGGGHGPLHYSLEDCSSHIWRSILNDSILTQSALNSVCALEVMVQ